MRILVDMNLSPAWVPFLVATGHEAVHWCQCGAPDCDDHEILSYAESNSYVVFTNDLDFGSILANTGHHGPSVVQVRDSDLLPKSIGTRLLQALAECEEAITAGALLTVDVRHQRVRYLPLR